MLASDLTKAFVFRHPRLYIEQSRRAVTPQLIYPSSFSLPSFLFSSSSSLLSIGSSRIFQFLGPLMSFVTFPESPLFPCFSQGNASNTIWTPILYCRCNFKEKQARWASTSYCVGNDNNRQAWKCGWSSRRSIYNNARYSPLRYKRKNKRNHKNMAHERTCNRKRLDDEQESSSFLQLTVQSLRTMLKKSIGQCRQFNGPFVYRCSWAESSAKSMTSTRKKLRSAVCLNCQNVRMVE